METSPSTNPASDQDAWSYEEAFCRNRGLISSEEQTRLRNSRVAVAGMGGVGGVHLVTLARLGIGRFTIADHDRFEVANFNRQYGARLPDLGRAKVEVMAAEARAINPEVELNIFQEAISPENVDQFLEGAEVLMDGIDFFSFHTRRLLFREAQKRGIWAITAGPIGFSTAWIVFDPAGMSFDEYFDLRDDMEPIDLFAGFFVGLTPQATHWSYFDKSQIEGSAARGPSLGLACQLCSGVAAAEAVKVILGRGPVRAAPWYAQFDAYRRLLRQKRLRHGNRGLLQRIKRSLLRKRMIQLGYGRA